MSTESAVHGKIVARKLAFTRLIFFLGHIAQDGDDPDLVLIFITQRFGNRHYRHFLLALKWLFST
jgi:hypothetical protein